MSVQYEGNDYERAKRIVLKAKEEASVQSTYKEPSKRRVQPGNQTWILVSSNSKQLERSAHWRRGF